MLTLNEFYIFIKKS